MTLATLAGSTHFALQTRLFVGLKRAGRIVDLIWLQQSPEYARTVLALAEAASDAELRETAMRLRELMADFLAPAKVTVLSVAKAEPELAPALAEAVDAAPRYIGQLR